MKTGLCNFSGFKIYPGRGVRLMRVDGKSFTFADSKMKRLFLNRKNPRLVAWTQTYRRIHKKGQTEEVIKRKARKVQKVERAIVGATLQQIQQKRNQKPEVRAAAREAAAKEVKDKKQAAANKAGASKTAAAKPAAKAKPANVPKVQKSAGKGASGGKGR
eukprot:TRINITY_DN27793_c0_g1_i1.p2 TRINITY_DN27793_c0_g1~~TRINITY_DN27793_c0_g1_i1.p2  ORF type:complete len:160 (-),score=94.08 TRINITY_DN27793_c0_g1_i1:66-545(-)